jgi:hypothetical protein
VNPGLDDDILARSVRALRREQAFVVTPVAGNGDDARWGREDAWSRIAADVRRARAVRRWVTIGALQLALALSGASVWGAATGRLQPAARAAMSAVRSFVSPARHACPAPRRSTTSDRDVGRGNLPGPVAPAPTPLAEAGPAATPAPHAAPERRSPRVVTPRASRPVPVAPAGAAATATPERPTALDRQPAGETHALLALYREAHRLHFVERDYAQALGAWDRYLASGSGPLVLEARYNRAIALAHLGRREEATAALRQFADGERGGYRRQEALALIEALRRGADSPVRAP